jgi:putative membrane protein
MFTKKESIRQIPGFFSYMELFSSNKLAYSLFIGTPITLGFLLAIINSFFKGSFDLFYFIRYTFFFFILSGWGTLFSITFYARKSPLLRAPPKGWALQINIFLCAVMGMTFLFGNTLAIILDNLTFQEVFFILGAVISYIVAFVVYFSFTTVSRPGYLILSLVQPVSAIILYSLYRYVWDYPLAYAITLSMLFFARAMIFFVVCALIFAIPYRRGLFQVSNIYKEATGMSGYPFIRAFILSMLTDGNDALIESYFDNVGIKSEVKIQYLFIRSGKTKELKGLFIIPNVHFGPFKTCGSSDLPEHLYSAFKDIPGTTVYHTTNDHTQNLTTQEYVEIILKRVKEDVHYIRNNEETEWIQETNEFVRKNSNSAKLLGTEIANIPIVFITRHPLPSDDIESKIGVQIRDFAKSYGYEDIIIIDAHNAIIGDEVLIKLDSIESQDLINASEKFLKSKKVQKTEKVQMLYGVANGTFKNYSEKDGIGIGGIVLHLFKNMKTDQKTALIHFDANNAYVDIRSYILNALQKRGIEKGEITTSDSHTVARQFSGRGYSPIGDKIEIDEILTKIDDLIQKAETNLEPVEFYYKNSIEDNIKIWGNPKYFNAILDTLKECIKVSQSLLTFSLIIPTFFSFILLFFLYNI